MRFLLSDHGEVFSTRPRGREMREQVKANLDPGDTLELSLVDVEALSYSFADEFVGALLQDLTPDRMTLEDVPASLHRVIGKSVARRGVDIRPDELFSVTA